MIIQINITLKDQIKLGKEKYRGNPLINGYHQAALLTGACRVVTGCCGCGQLNLKMKITPLALIPRQTTPLPSPRDRNCIARRIA